MRVLRKKAVFVLEPEVNQSHGDRPRTRLLCFFYFFIFGVDSVTDVY